MSTTRWVVVTTLLLLFGIVTVRAGEKKESPQLPKNWKFSLPAGNAEAGRAAFQKMECYSCHKVPGAGLPVERTSGGVGPDLVPAYSKLPREFLAESIIDSHKYISGTLEHYRGLDKVSSKMGDYSSIMTVRELLDIVEFLKQLKAKPPGPASP
jgi:cytochrome c553